MEDELRQKLREAALKACAAATIHFGHGTKESTHAGVAALDSATRVYEALHGVSWSGCAIADEDSD